MISRVQGFVEQDLPYADLCKSQLLPSFLARVLHFREWAYKVGENRTRARRTLLPTGMQSIFSSSPRVVFTVAGDNGVLFQNRKVGIINFHKQSLSSLYLLDTGIVLCGRSTDLLQCFDGATVVLLLKVS